MSKIGNTIVNGNLNIQGSNTEFNSDAIKIKDNIITLNSKETSNKISNGKAGIEIERGSSTNYQLVYDETDSELKAGLSNNLKPLSSKEYSDNNIANTQTNLNEQIYQNDYINVLPKIGYYQEDTVQVMSKYNMNIMDYNGTNCSTITIDEYNNYVLYFKGSDGSYNKSLGLYKATCSNLNSNFIFFNEPLNLAFLGNNKQINTILGADDDWIVISTTDGSCYLINTFYSTNSSMWQIYKDITSIYIQCNQDNIRGIRWFKDYGTIAITYWYSWSTNATYCAYLSIYRYSDLARLQLIGLENWSNHVYLSNNYSFNKNKLVHKYSDPNATAKTTWSWNDLPVFLLYKEKNCLIFHTYLYVTYWNYDTKQAINDKQISIKMMYKVPQDVWKGTSSNITIITENGENTSKVIVNENTNMLNEKKQSVLATNPFNNSNFINVSYNTRTGKIFYSQKDRDSTTTTYFRIVDIDNNFDKNNITIPDRLGTAVTEFYGPARYLTPPDASLWGKQIYKFVNMFDKIFIACLSMDDPTKQKVILVNKWQYVSGIDKNAKCIEPVPGYYYDVTNGIKIDQTSSTIHDNVPFGATTNRSILGTTQTGHTFNGASGWSTTVNSDKSVRYFLTNNDVVNGLVVYEVGYTGENAQFKLTYSKIIDIPLPSQFSNAQQIVTGSTNLSRQGCFYNSNGDYWLVINKNISNEQSDPNWGCIGFFILEKNGTVHTFTPDFIKNRLNGGLKDMYNTQQNNKPTYASSWYIGLATFTSKTEVLLNSMCSYGMNTSVYSTIIKFNSNFTDFTMSYGYRASRGFNIGTFDGIRMVYSGKKYGFTEQSNSYSFYPNTMRFQNKLMPEDIDYDFDKAKSDLANNSNLYYMYLQSSQGLIAYVPSIPIFLGGYFEVIQNPIAVNLQPNTNNYIYLERDSSTKKLKAYASTTKDIEEGSKQFSRILLARVLTDSANPIETEYYRINTGYNDYIFYHKITIKQTPNQTIHVYTTENGQRIDHTSSFFVKINSNIQYNIEIKPDLWYVAGTLQNISSSGIINQNIIVSTTTANLISTNYSYDFKMEYVPSNNPPIYRFGNNYSSTFPDDQNYKGNVTPIDQLGIYTNLDSVIHYQYTKPLPDEIKSVFIKLVCKDGEHFLGHFIRDEFDQYGDVYHSKVLGTQENLNLFKRLYDTKEVFTCVTGIET